MIYSFGINTDFGNRSLFDSLPCVQRNKTDLFMTRPSGVVSKKLIGALIIEDNSVSCNPFDAL